MAARKSAEQVGREIDQAVESTGHLPGYYDTDPDSYFDAVDAERYVQRDAYVNSVDEGGEL